MPTKPRRRPDRRLGDSLALDPAEELTLTFSPGAGGSFVVTAASSEGEAQGPFRLPWDNHEMRLLSRSLGRDTRNARPSGAEPDEPAWDPWREGRRLHEALFAAPALRDLLEATRAAQRSLRFRLRLVLDPDQPEMAMLHAIPWELLFRRDHGEVTALEEDASVARSLMVRGRPRSFERPRRLRVLMISSGARDLDLEAERAGLEETADAHRRLEVGFERAASLSRLETLLEAAAARGRPYDVLHLAGHGEIAHGPNGGSLRWELGRGPALDLSGRALATLLRSFPTLRLVVLNACHTGELPGGAGDPFAGVASALLQTGLPAVVAIQGAIADDAAILCARVLYGQLAAGEPPEVAITAARRALFLEAPDELEWIKPILFLGMTRPRIPRRLLRLAAATLSAAIACVLVLILVVRWQHCRMEARSLANAINGSVALLKEGRAIDALAEIDHAAERVDCESVPLPLRAAAHATAGLAAQAAGDLEQALDRTSEAILLDPGHAPHRVQLAVLLVLSGREDESVRVLLDAIALDPDAAEAHGALGSVYLDLKRPAAARKALQRALATRPSDGLLHASLGWANLQLDRPREAAGAFRRALECLPRDQIGPRADAAFGLVQAAQVSEDPATVCAALARFRSEDPDAVTEHALDAERLEAGASCRTSIGR